MYSIFLFFHLSCNFGLHFEIMSVKILRSWNQCFLFLSRSLPWLGLNLKLAPKRQLFSCMLPLAELDQVWSAPLCLKTQSEMAVDRVGDPSPGSFLWQFPYPCGVCNFSVWLFWFPQPERSQVFQGTLLSCTVCWLHWAGAKPRWRRHAHMSPRLYSWSSRPSPLDFINFCPLSSTFGHNPLCSMFWIIVVLRRGMLSARFLIHHAEKKPTFIFERCLHWV